MPILKTKKKGDDDNFLPRNPREIEMKMRKMTWKNERKGFKIKWFISFQSSSQMKCKYFLLRLLLSLFYFPFVFYTFTESHCCSYYRTREGTEE